MGSEKSDAGEKSIRAGILQFCPIKGDVDYNRSKIRALLSRRKFDLAVLPELATSGYNFATREDLADVAETRRGESFAFFADLAARHDGAIVWALPEKAGNRIYNSAVMTTPEGRHHVYRKTHLFFREKPLFDPGDSGFRVFNWRGIKIGLMICFDWIFPESARTLTLKGAQIICHPSNLVMPYCQTAMVTRSQENGVYCITSNRIGTESIPDLSLTFTGRSQITDPKGNKVLGFNRFEEGFQSVKIWPRRSDTKSVTRYNDLIGDRRVEYYTL